MAERIGVRRRLARFANPALRLIAGGYLRSASLLKHTGRRSGRAYANPVGAFPLEDGFVVALLYGDQVHWYRNVLAAGGCTLVTRGREHHLERPELVDAARAVPAFPPPWRLVLRGIRAERFLLLHRPAGH